MDFRLRNRATKQDRVDLRYRGKRRALVAPDQAANFLLGGADESVDGRSDARVVKVEPSLGEFCVKRLDLGLGGLLGGERVVEFLLTYRLLRDEGSISSYVIVGFFEPRMGRGEVGLGLSESSLKRLRVDPIQELALLDEGAFNEIHRNQIAFDPGTNLDVLRAQRGPDELDAVR